MDKKNNSTSKYNVFYYDDYNKKHLAYNLSLNDLNFIYTRYGKDKVKLAFTSHQLNSRTPVFQTGDVGAAPTWGF